MRTSQRHREAPIAAGLPMRLWSHTQKSDFKKLMQAVTAPDLAPELCNLLTRCRQRRCSGLGRGSRRHLAGNAAAISPASSSVNKAFWCRRSRSGCSKSAVMRLARHRSQSQLRHDIDSCSPCSVPKYRQKHFQGLLNAARRRQKQISLGRSCEQRFICSETSWQRMLFDAVCIHLPTSPASQKL